MTKADAAGGYLAVGEPDRPETWTVVAHRALGDNLTQQVQRWYAGHTQTVAGPRLMSRLSPGDPLLRNVPALADYAASCVFLPVVANDRAYGVLFLTMRSTGDGALGFELPTLDYLTAYLGFVALLLADKVRHPVDAPPRSADGSFADVITCDEGLLEVLALIRKVAPSDLTVLLSGETGTGKGLLAYSLHALSRRASRRFLAINCAAIPETLLESELFGHVKGSFTGADTDKKGLIAEAEGGTIFLDEIGKMPLAMQGKLLHFMDSRVVRPVGAVQERQVDVRVVCATKSDLRQMTETGRFLEDLYFRLLDFPVVVPPLRERVVDIPLLTGHFVQRFCAEASVPPPAIADTCLDALVGYHWPGNVRELEKCLRRALVLAEGEPVLRPDHLPREIAPFRTERQSGGVAPLRDTLAGVESREIAKALRVANGNKSAAARALHVSYPNLLKKIKFYGLES
jgi:transcriptional regulator with PAS, ATPase and Fis domain